MWSWVDCHTPEDPAWCLVGLLLCVVKEVRHWLRNHGCGVTERRGLQQLYQLLVQVRGRYDQEGDLGVLDHVVNKYLAKEVIQWQQITGMTDMGLCK